MIEKIVLSILGLIWVACWVVLLSKMLEADDFFSWGVVFFMAALGSVISGALLVLYVEWMLI